jgi:hypothetical protein
MRRCPSLANEDSLAISPEDKRIPNAETTDVATALDCPAKAKPSGPRHGSRTPIAHTVIYNNKDAAGLMVRTPLPHLCIVSGSVWLILHNIGLRKG